MNTVLAVSYCARQLGVEALIVVPKATKERICETIRGDGSQLILYGEVTMVIYLGTSIKQLIHADCIGLGCIRSTCKETG